MYRCGDVAAAKGTLEAINAASAGAPDSAAWLCPKSVDNLVSMDFLSCNQRLNYQSFLQMLCGMGHADASSGNAADDTEGAKTLIMISGTQEIAESQPAGNSIHCCTVEWPSNTQQARHPIAGRSVLNACAC